MHGHGVDERGSAKSTLLAGIALALVGVVGWHLYAASLLREEAHRRLPAERGRAEIELQAFTNVVTIRFPTPRELEREGKDVLGRLGAAIGSMLGGALATAIEPSIERDLNTRARELFDLYAMLLPYRVKVIVAEPGEET